MGGEWMIETIMLIVVIFVLSGVFWYSLFYEKEKKLLNRLQQMLDCAIDGELERTEVSEEKYSALENSMKQYIDSSFLAGKNQQEQKEVIQKLISDIAHQTLTPVSYTHLSKIRKCKSSAMPERERRCYQGCPEILCDDLDVYKRQVCNR